MAGRDSAKGIKNSGNSKVRRRGLVVVGGAVGAFAAAAAMATGSAAPAKADIRHAARPDHPAPDHVADRRDRRLRPRRRDGSDQLDRQSAQQPELDRFGVAVNGRPCCVCGIGDNRTSRHRAPNTHSDHLQEGTEPTVQASIEGGSDQTLLVDTGSSGLVIPATDLSLTQLVDLGIPTGINEAGYTGGVDYIYLTYDDATVDYGNGALDTTNTPIDVEILSWPTSLSSGSPLDFQQFLSDNDVTGILGIGDNTAGPTTSPLESYGGVLVDVPQNELIVDSTNPGTAIDTVSGAPIANLYETVTTNGVTTVGSAVSDDVDSGGVYGTIPSSLASDVAPGSTITVYSSQGGTELYSYTWAAPASSRRRRRGPRSTAASNRT